MKKVKGKNGILNALKHNKRELQTERGAGANIDAFRTPLNYSLTDPSTAEQIDRKAKVLRVEAGIDKTRKNQVMALEIIFSLPTNRRQQDTRPFFQDCLAWTKQYIPGELLSFDIHLDESAPHAHALILPLVNSRMNGHKIMGNKGNLISWINRFYSGVAVHHGLSRNQSKYLAGKQKETIEKQVLTQLVTDPVMKSTIWPCVRDAIHKDPLPYAQLLGIDQQTGNGKRKSFTQIMTSKGKGKAINAI
ncbi:MAG: plasmid recombination protein [Burkholderiales bacterium]|nr:plasmid recombination protein [Nitrosomonas sp.]MCP5274009.1 plasmid recombination protein [Burkholderiales bacterium]